MYIFTAQNEKKGKKREKNKPLKAFFGEKYFYIAVTCKYKSKFL